jgi:hypothetical protein
MNTDNDDSNGYSSDVTIMVCKSAIFVSRGDAVSAVSSTLLLVVLDREINN